jgi:spermidine synthase
VDLWYSEKIGGNAGFTVRIERQLLHLTSEYQTIDIFETSLYGKFLVIDGAVMLTEADEFVYHESITHVPLGWLSDPRHALIIGGGDGGTARELLRYPSIERLTMVEIDREVIEASKKFFPTLSNSFGDPRLEVRIQDGARFVKEARGKFDLIIVDSTDPVGPGKVLFSEEFYRDCSRLLRTGGILTAQTESPYDRNNHHVIRDIYTNLRGVFENARMYLASIPTYPFGLWSFALASDRIDPLVDPPAAHDVPRGLKYYNRRLGRSVFELPNFVREITEA